MKRLAILMMLTAACGQAEPEVGMMQTAVVQSMTLAREEPAGVAPGFDLDGIQSDTLDSRSCNKPDFRDPEGRMGIDNQLATFIPLLELTGEGALEGLVQTTINEGRLLLVMEAELLDDDRARVTVLRGDDVPLLGTDGHILAGQTLALHEAPLLGHAEEGRIEGGVLQAGPFDLDLPVVVFNILYDLQLRDAYVRFTLDAEGNFTNGVLGGAASMDQLIDFLRRAGERADADYVSLIGGGLMDSADMDRDGRLCKSMSMAVTFRAVPAFTF